jgi:hypothetical protein
LDDQEQVREVLAHSALPMDPAVYAAEKAGAAAKAGEAAGAEASAAGPAPSVPVPFVSWSGVKDEGVAPSDSTGAIGPDRYIELVNRQFAIYDRAGGLLSTGTLSTLAGVSARNVFDPQVMWDSQTQRFYYAADSVEGNFVNSYLAFGWSMTSSPTTAADFCHYEVDPYPGSDLFPDYPKLGDSQDWGLIGVNVFDPPGFGFVRADAFFFRKPPAGTTCPLPPFTGVRTDLRDQNGTGTFTPVPLQSQEPATALTGDGAILSNDPYQAGQQNFITRFQVRNGGFGPIIENPGKSIPIPVYSFPANADQPGFAASIDTLDGRLTQGVLSLDPRLGKRAGWTQHTVFGGNGAEVRWYEVDVFGLTVLQSGVVTDPARDVFNGAISSDRAHNGVSRAFGANMVMGFNTSSSAEFVKILMVSKVGAGAQSGPVLIVASPGENFDHTCVPPNGPPCRWGDYAAATPDPAADQTAATGQVWLTNMWNDDSPPGNIDTDWRTWNWGALP